MSLNLIKALLILNAKKAVSKKGVGKTKGWTDEARAKAAATRKRKAKVAVKKMSKKPDPEYAAHIKKLYVKTESNSKVKSGKSKSISKPVSVGGGGALKTRNELTKHFGLKKAWGGDSNPYSDTQSLSGTLHPKKSEALLKHLDSPDSGWTKDNSSVLPGNNLYKKGQDIIVVGKSYKAMDSKDYVHVSIHGPKKKKAYTIPYYD